MNYLAHSHLSYTTPDLLVGNYIADMVTSKEVDRLPIRYSLGISLHRHIDSYTDQHPIVRQATAILRNTQGKYAPVVIDVMYDYILTRNWDRFCEESLPSVIEKTYGHLTAALESLPHRIHPKINGMIQNDALRGYSSIEGIQKTMGFLSRRAKFENGFLLATSELENHYDELESGFLQFYPDLVHSCAIYLDKSNKPPSR